MSQDNVSHTGVPHQASTISGHQPYSCGDNVSKQGAASPSNLVTGDTARHIGDMVKIILLAGDT